MIILPYLMYRFAVLLWHLFKANSNRVMCFYYFSSQHKCFWPWSDTFLSSQLFILRETVSIPLCFENMTIFYQEKVKCYSSNDISSIYRLNLILKILFVECDLGNTLSIYC